MNRVVYLTAALLTSVATAWQFALVNSIWGIGPIMLSALGAILFYASKDLEEDKNE